ncbi:hypothetical protein [Piscirickettsia litoralis]|uniref:hypothetical protein n=1 Tax=Piscirickettsia litoralis TaxID=1891921 RepID=UPI001F40312E|nr:hypothetical protein [Piscirickettsia litoralis]
MKYDELSTHWRDSAFYPKFYMLDARVCFPFVLIFFTYAFEHFINFINSSDFFSNT